MARAAAAEGTARPVDARALQAIVARLRQRAQSPWLHAEVARRMAERLSLVKRQPATIVDWDAPLGASGELLARAYPKARLIAVDPLLAAPPPAAPWWRLRRRATLQPPAAVADGSAELLWSNMALHFVGDIEAQLRRWRQAAAVDGFLMFSTLGPGSLALLRELHRDAGWGPALADFVDMHDLGDMLLQAGFADPVMDQETLTLTWPDPAAALAELRSLGGNASPQRFTGLRTPRWRHRLQAALHERRDAGGRIGLAFEVVYGHAFCPPPRAALAASTSIPVEQMRAMARSGRKP